MLLYVLFTLVAQSLMAAPVVVTWLAPARAEHWLGALEGWLQRNERVIMIAVAADFWRLVLLEGH
ncbi:MAG: hypothetical protein R2854_06330 [Caldilineaceae bacterium]